MLVNCCVNIRMKRLIMKEKFSLALRMEEAATE